MAKSELERKKAQLAREEKKRQQLLDCSYPYLEEPFFTWLNDSVNYGWSIINPHLDISQISVPKFDDDRGPHSSDGEIERGYASDSENSPYAGFQGSIGRAERLVDDLLAVASNLALAINVYKKEQLNKKITEIEQSNLSNQDVKLKALADTVRIKKILEMLEKTKRISVYEYKVKETK